MNMNKINFIEFCLSLSFIYFTSIIQKAELIYAFLKARMLALCGQTWWRKPENPGKTTEPGPATTTLTHALTTI